MIREILEKMRLKESPTAILGDADFSDLPGFNFGKPKKFVYEKNWKIIYKTKINNKNFYYVISKKHGQTIEILTDYNSNANDEFERYEIIGRIELIRVKTYEQIKKEYRPLYQVSKIFIDKRFRKRGLGKLSYLIMLEILKYNIMSDGIQYDSPRIIYSILSKFDEIYCDIIDISKKKIIKENYIIFHNEKELWDFDETVWKLYDLDKSNIRIVLYIKRS